jgi:hypothetical protein
MRDRFVRTTGLLAAGLAVLAVVNVFIWMESDAADCHPSCSFGQDLTGLGLLVLPTVAILLIVAGAVRWVLLRRRLPKA